MKLFSFKEAAGRSGGDFYADFPLRAWNVFAGIRNHRKMCGKLCSLRFTWMTPEKAGSHPDALAWLLDLGRELAGTPLEKLFVNRNGKVLYALARYAGFIAAEIEINEALPDTMEEIHFIKANFDTGIVTNQPLAGHFNCEGAVFADASGCRTVFTENHRLAGEGGFLAHCRSIQKMMIENGDYPAGPLHSAEIARVLKEAER